MSRGLSPEPPSSTQLVLHHPPQTPESSRPAKLLLRLLLGPAAWANISAVPLISLSSCVRPGSSRSGSRNWEPENQELKMLVFHRCCLEGRRALFWVMKCSKQSCCSISMPSAPSSTQPESFHSLLMLCESSFPPKAHQDSQSQNQHQRLLYNLVFSFPTPPLPRSPHYTLHPIRSPLPFAVLSVFNYAVACR